MEPKSLHSVAQSFRDTFSAKSLAAAFWGSVSSTSLSILRVAGSAVILTDRTLPTFLTVTILAALRSFTALQVVMTGTPDALASSFMLKSRLGNDLSVRTTSTLPLLASITNVS